MLAVKLITDSVSMYIMCVLLCLLGAFHYDDDY